MPADAQLSCCVHWRMNTCQHRPNSRACGELLGSDTKRATLLCKSPRAIRDQRLKARLPRLLRFGPPGSCQCSQSCPAGSAELPLRPLNGFAGLCGPELRPSCLGRGANPGDAGGAHLSLPGCSWCGLSRTTKKLAEFLLQRLNPFLDGGCPTELLRCYIYHGGRSVDGFGG